MIRNLLLVDDQREILRLLRSSLETLKNKDINLFEAQSGEEALLESSRAQIHMLVTDYKLPGISGVELMHKVRARHPEVKVVFISGMTEKKMRNEMINSGAFAIFEKPVPMADFLDVVERGLGLVQTIFPPEISADIEASDEPATRLSDLLANFRQDFNADAVFLLNERGLIHARTGNLHDPSMEVSLISTLMAIHNTSLKVAKHNHQETIESYHVFNGGDHDLLFILVTSWGNPSTDRLIAQHQPTNFSRQTKRPLEYTRGLDAIGPIFEIDPIWRKTPRYFTIIGKYRLSPVSETST